MNRPDAATKHDGCGAPARARAGSRTGLARVNEIVCDSCGVSNAPGTEFCTGCGSFLDWEGATSGPSHPTDHPNARPAPAPADRWRIATTRAVDDRPTATGPVARSRHLAGPRSAPREHPRAAVPLGSAEVGYRLIVPQGAPPPPGLVGPGDGGPSASGLTGRSAVGGSSTAVLQAEPIAPGTCPECGRVNPPELRFCAKCGHRFPDRTPAETESGAATAEKIPWWRRWIPRRRLGTASARRSFRRSLPDPLPGAALHHLGRRPGAGGRGAVRFRTQPRRLGVGPDRRPPRHPGAGHRPHRHRRAPGFRARRPPARVRDRQSRRHGVGHGLDRATRPVRSRRAIAWRSPPRPPPVRGGPCCSRCRPRRRSGPSMSRPACPPTTPSGRTSGSPRPSNCRFPMGSASRSR